MNILLFALQFKLITPLPDNNHFPSCYVMLRFIRRTGCWSLEGRENDENDIIQ